VFRGMRRDEAPFRTRRADIERLPGIAAHDSSCVPRVRSFEHVLRQPHHMSDGPESHGKDDTRLGMDERRTASEQPTTSLRQLVVELPHNLDDVRMRAQSIPGIGDLCEGLTDRRVRTYRTTRDLVEGSVDSRLDIGGSCRASRS
jgi:hypothetical protein